MQRQDIEGSENFSKVMFGKPGEMEQGGGGKDSSGSDHGRPHLPSKEALSQPSVRLLKTNVKVLSVTSQTAFHPIALISSGFHDVIKLVALNPPLKKIP